MELKKYKLEEIAEIIPGYAFKSSDFGHGKNIAIKIKDIVPPGIDIKNADTVDVHPGERYQLQSGDYVMAMTGATIGKIGKIGNCEKRIFINQRVCKFIANNLCDKEYLYYVLNSDYFQKFVLNNIDSKLAQPNIGHPTLYKFFAIKDIDFTRWDSGTGVPSMTASTLYHLPIIKPNSDLLKRFDEAITPLFYKIKQIRVECEELTKQRDELLPLLMNGQVSVNSDLSHD